jgi:hypothetical protein
MRGDFGSECSDAIVVCNITRKRKCPRSAISCHVIQDALPARNTRYLRTFFGLCSSRMARKDAATLWLNPGCQDWRDITHHAPHSRDRGAGQLHTMEVNPY